MTTYNNGTQDFNDNILYLASMSPDNIKSYIMIVKNNVCYYKFIPVHKGKIGIYGDRPEYIGLLWKNYKLTQANRLVQLKYSKLLLP